MISRGVERRADGLFGSLQEPQPILSSEGQMRLAREVKDARSLLSVADWPLEGFFVFVWFGHSPLVDVQ